MTRHHRNPISHPRPAPGLAALIPVLGLVALGGVAVAGGEIYGTVTTDKGTTLTGAIRWDRNENFWDDILDARKTKEVEGKRGRQEVRIFGLQISRSGERSKIRSELSIPFGHIRSIEPMPRDRFRIELRNGDVLEARGSADLGSSMRGIEVEDAAEGTVELDWDAVKRIEFAGNPGPGRDAERLYGTVENSGARFTGYIVWDRDESLLDDILDGEEDGRKYKIPFRKIAGIEKAGRKGSRVMLQGGREMVLTGTNDVDDDNRGILVTVPGVGSVEISWDEFRRVEFFEAPPSRTYDTFDGGGRLYGTVTARDGNTYRGEIVWDNDEEYTWEPLDGETAGADFAILFGNIAVIRRLSDESATVTLHNGDTFVLEDSNDVDEDNKGIFIRLADGEEVELSWDEFEKVEFPAR